MNYLQNIYNTYHSFLKYSLHYRVKDISLKMLQLLYQFLMTKLCRTFMITLWIVNRFEKHILRIWN